MAKRIKIPGVFVDEQSNPSLIIPTENLRSVGIVGTAPGYLMQNITVTHITGDAADVIPDIASEDIIELLGLYIGDLLISATKYSFSGTTITWIDQAYADSISQYTVKLRTTKASTYYDATVFTQYNQSFTNVYGYPVIDNAVNQLSAAAYLAFAAGAPRVVAVQAASGSLTDLKSGIDKLQAEDVSIIVVPGITNTTLQTYLKDHVDIMSSAEGKKERVAFVAPTDLSASVETISAQSESFADQRVFNLAPASVNMTLSNGLTDTSIKLSSIYAGASLAGRLANPNIRIAKPLTRESVANVDSTDVRYLKVERETLAGSGTLVMYTDNAGVVRINQGLTTDVSNFNNSEISVVMIKDELRKSFRDSLDAQFIGGELDPIRTPGQVESAVVSILNSKIGTLITAYKDISVELDPVDPSAINVSVWVSVIRPFNYINLTYTVYTV